MQPMSFYVPRGAASLSIFHEQQPNRRVGIIKYRLGYTATEDIQEAVHRRRGSAGAERWESSEDLRHWEVSHLVVTLYTQPHTHTYAHQAEVAKSTSWAKLRKGKA